MCGSHLTLLHSPPVPIDWKSWNCAHDAKGREYLIEPVLCSPMALDEASSALTSKGPHWNTRQKWRPCAAAGRAAVRRTVLCARDALSGHDAEAPRRVAARRSVEMIKLAGGAFRRLLEARLTYSSPKVSARRSCTNPRCPQLRSPHVHRERSSLKPHASRMQNVGFNFL